MDTIQKLFEKEIMGEFAFTIMGIKVIKQQLKKKGIVLNEKQSKIIEKALYEKGKKVKFKIDLDDNQINVLGLKKGENITLEIAPNDKEINDIYNEYLENIKKLFPDMVKEMAKPLLTGLRDTAPKMLREHANERIGFEKRLLKAWKKPFNLLEMFIVIAYEAGEEINVEIRKDNLPNDKYLLEVLMRLHARACQIASEILVLIKSGYSDGAIARWRTLHEIAVVASFINKHGNEVAERYLLHDGIESFKVANQYKIYYKALGEEQLNEEEYIAVKNNYEKLIIRYGKPYRFEYGWAASAINKAKPNFSDIVEDSGLSINRPYYKMASHNVHANPKGIMFKLGLIPPNSNKILLAGPSNSGFTDPAQCTAISLGSITIELITIKPTIDNLILRNILLILESEIGEEFLKVQKEIEKKAV
jgi:hypothetical protein